MPMDSGERQPSKSGDTENWRKGDWRRWPRAIRGWCALTPSEGGDTERLRKRLMSRYSKWEPLDLTNKGAAGEKRVRGIFAELVSRQDCKTRERQIKFRVESYREISSLLEQADLAKSGEQTKSLLEALDASCRRLKDVFQDDGFTEDVGRMRVLGEQETPAMSTILSSPEQWLSFLEREKTLLIRHGLPEKDAEVLITQCRELREQVRQGIAQPERVRIAIMTFRDKVCRLRDHRLDKAHQQQQNDRYRHWAGSALSVVGGATIMGINVGAAQGLSQAEIAVSAAMGTALMQEAISGWIEKSL